MKNFKLLIVLIIGIFSISSLSALDTDIKYTAFKSKDKQYIEVSLFVVGKTAFQLPIDSTHYQASVEVLILIEKNEEIVQFDKYILNGPVATRPTDFLDLKRFALPRGDYLLKVEVKDKNKPEAFVRFKENFSLNYSSDKIEQSEIQLLSSFKPSEDKTNPLSKYGYNLEPLAFNFYNKRANRLIFYNEVYNADTALQGDFQITYSITEVTSENLKKPISIGHKKKKALATTPIFLQMDISELASGNYELSVEIIDEKQNLLSTKKVKFQRSNPYLKEALATSNDIKDEFVQYLNKEELNYALRAIAVILSDKDGEYLNGLIANGTEEGQRLYLFNHFIKQNPVKPYEEYISYMRIAKAIDEQFNSGFGYGFETDRGYVYMKYGQPSDIQRQINDPSAPPYEIWSYNDFPQTNQSLVKFIFYNPSLSPGNYTLLHSTARGEISTPDWQREIYRNVPNSNNGANMNEQGGSYGNGRNAGSNWDDW